MDQDIMSYISLHNGRFDRSQLVSSNVWFNLDIRAPALDQSGKSLSSQRAVSRSAIHAVQPPVTSEVAKSICVNMNWLQSLQARLTPRSR